MFGVKGQYNQATGQRRRKWAVYDKLSLWFRRGRNRCVRIVFISKRGADIERCKYDGNTT